MEASPRETTRFGTGVGANYGPSDRADISDLMQHAISS
jgi:hypothetical protein